jgi:hypothetical protein
MIRIFIGYDPREAVAFHAASHSLLTRSSLPLAITPLALSTLSGLMDRPRDPLQSTDFSFSRFLIPLLCDYQGWAIYMDCDVLVRDDISRLWACRDERYAVQVVKQQQDVSKGVKFLGARQVAYGKKNWSSVMLFNNPRCTRLTAEYVNTASGLDLHQFKWLSDDALIGDLPAQWNHLVGYSTPSDDAALVHFTDGGPYFAPWKDCEFADEWFRERQRMLHADAPEVEKPERGELEER